MQKGLFCCPDGDLPRAVARVIVGSLRMPGSDDVGVCGLGDCGLFVPLLFPLSFPFPLPCPCGCEKFEGVGVGGRVMSFPSF